MCSNDTSDFLQELWVKYLKCSYKNKSEFLSSFLNSLYFHSIRKRNIFESNSFINDTSGVFRLLNREFLNDLENVCIENDDNDKKIDDVGRLRKYLETERGTMILYGIDAILEQILSTKEDRIEFIRSTVIKIINDAELSNILATTLLSVLSSLDDNGVSESTSEEAIVLPDSSLSDFFYDQIYRSSISKKVLQHRTSVSQIDEKRDLSSDENDHKTPITIGKQKIPRKPKKSFKSKKKNMSKNTASYNILSNVYVFEPLSGTEIGELFQTDITEVDIVHSDLLEASLHFGNVVTTLRIVTRLLGHLILFDSSLCDNAISIHLETFNICCQLLGDRDPSSYDISQNVVKLAEDLIYNIGIIMKMLFVEGNNEQTSVSMLLGHKVIDRLLLAYQSLAPKRETFVSLIADLNQLVIYIFITVAKKILSAGNQIFRGIIQLFTSWYLNNGQDVAQWTLDGEFTFNPHRKSKATLFAQLCTLLSLLDEFQLEKGIIDFEKPNREVSSHHSDKFNLVLTANRKDTAETCCYALICELLLNNLINLLILDSNSTFIGLNKIRLYQKILNYIKSVKFCCSINILSYSSQLLNLLVNQRSCTVKIVILRFLQILIEISFEFYKSKESCPCQYSSRHDISVILRNISVACLPKVKDSECLRQHYPTTPADLLHFFDWLARRQDDRMKALVIDVVINPILLRLQLYSVDKSCQQYHLLGAAVLSLMPYLNGKWENDDIELADNVCKNNPILQSTLYKCLTVIVLSTKPESSSLSNEVEIRTRIIKYLLSRINFDSFMMSLNSDSVSPEHFISILLKDTEVWYCYRLLFSYNEEFRRNMFEQQGIDCCYIILKQVLQHISQIQSDNLEEVDKSIFSLFESLMCLVVDGNMLKETYYYEGFSCDVIWTQLQSAILKDFPNNKLISKLILESMFNCCFRQKWTVRDGLYQLRQLFLDSIVNMNLSTGGVDVDSDLDDIDDEQNSLKKDSSTDTVANHYEADVSSGITSFEENSCVIIKSKDTLRSFLQKSSIFMNFNVFEGTNNHLEINGTLVELLMKVILASKMEENKDIQKEILESIYFIIRTLPAFNQNQLVSEDFVEEVSKNIKDILIQSQKSDLQLVLLRLLVLPSSSWCTSARLRFLIKISQKNGNLTADILQMLIEKALLIQTFQPEISIKFPMSKDKVPTQDLVVLDPSQDNEADFGHLVHSPLTNYQWKSLDPEFVAENGGFSISMWIQMEVKGSSCGRKRKVDYKNSKKKLSKQGSSNKSFPIHREILGYDQPEDQDLVHIITLYSRERVTQNKIFSIQIWCMPAFGTVVVRLYEHIERQLIGSQPNIARNKARSSLGSIFTNIFTTSSNSVNQDSEPFVVLDSPSSMNSFSLVDESVIHGLISSVFWNFLTITVNWCLSKSVTITWLLNGDINRQTKLHRNKSRTLRGSYPLESFIAIGHTNRSSKITSQHYNLGNIFLFENPVVTCGNDNLSLMLLTPNWDGSQISSNSNQQENSKLLASVVMRLLVDMQITTESAALLLERGQNILSNGWLDRISGFISSNLVGTYRSDDPLRFCINPAYTGESQFLKTDDSSRKQSLIDGNEQFFDPMKFNEVLSEVKMTLDSALENLGGVSVLIFWLAKLVEKEDDNSIRYLLKIIFLLLRKSIFLSYQNMHESGYSIIFQLFKSFKMNLNLEMIKEIINHTIYECPVKSRVLSTQSSLSRLCRDPYLLRELLLQWKMWASSKESANQIEAKTGISKSLELDKFLLSQINCLLNEDNIYSNINCGSLGFAGILYPLLLACEEPFDTLPTPLPSEIFKLITQIINNFIPTPADLSTVTKLCNTILKLYQVSMKENQVDAGKYFRTLKSFIKPEWEVLEIDRESKLPPNSVNRQSKTDGLSVVNVNLSPQLITDPTDSRLSQEEIKAMQKFYGETLSDTPNISERNGKPLRDIEKSSESGTSGSSTTPTLINDEDEPSVTDVPYEENYLTQDVIEANLFDKMNIGNASHSSRIETLAGLISTLENVIQVKISDTILVQLSMQNFCFEFIIHLLTHPSPVIRHRSLSLFRVYICQKRSLVQVTIQQPHMLNVVAYIIHQNSATPEIVAETVSIIFGHNITALICEIDWENTSTTVTRVSKSGILKENFSINLPSIDCHSKLEGIVSLIPEQLTSFPKFDDMVNQGKNHFGLSYRRSSVLLLATLTNIEWCSMEPMLRFCDWLFFQNPVLLAASIKSGLYECVCNLCSHFSGALKTQENEAFQSLLNLCVTITTDVTVTAQYSNFLKLLDLCEIMYFDGLRISKILIEKGQLSEVLQQTVVKTIINTSITTIGILNEKDPYFRINFADEGIQKRIDRLPRSFMTDETALSQKLIKTIKTATNMLINTQEYLFPFSMDLFTSVGLKIVEFLSKIISNCLTCNVIPDNFSIYFYVKEHIKNNLGDLIISLTNPKLDISLRLDLLQSLLKLENVQRVVRYSLLGNSSGSICLILNLKQIIHDLQGSVEWHNSISTLLEIISLDFDVEIIKEDNRNLWIQDWIQKLSKWKYNFNETVSLWNMNADRSHVELLTSLRKCQNSYRPYARKNLQEQYIATIKEQRSSEFYRRRTWKTLITNFTQERALWANDVTQTKFMQLDPTEGSGRIRRRMTKTVLNLDKRFFKPDSIQSCDPSEDRTLDFLFNSTYSVDRMVFEWPIKFQLLKCIEDVHLSCPCVWVCQSGTFEGEFFVGRYRIGFLVDNVNSSQNSYDQLPNPLKDYGFISWRLNEINWVLKRRFKLRDLALEVFMKDGRNCLIAANSTYERDGVINRIESFLPPTTNIKPRLIEIQNKWITGEMTNFDYLTILNTASGRSYNDIMQYPVFPFILSNYSTYILNLEEESTFRNLSNPITVQNESLRDKVAQNFADKADEYQRQLNIARMSDDVENMPIWAVPPHHYSSLYSNSATVLYYMIRVPPFTQKFIEFQDNQFDRPDRIFHTLESAWELSTSSISCVKEIIPEFFYLPEMFTNQQSFDFGERSNGCPVDDVVLPRWCDGNARIFCLIHRVALESAFVSAKLNQWVDLIFGYKQSGKSALDAMNLFHPYSYFNAISPDEISDPIRRKAVEQMIDNYGQIPKQLFLNRPHASKKIRQKANKKDQNIRTQSVTGVEKTSNASKDDIESTFLQKDRSTLSVLPNVIGIPWGDWVGSPQNSQTFMNTVSSISNPDARSFYLLPKSKYNKQSFKMLVLPQCSDVLFLSSVDDDILPIIRFSSIFRHRRINISSMTLSYSYNLDYITEEHAGIFVSAGSGKAAISCMAVYQRAGRIFFGMDSGLIEVFQGDVNKYTQITPFLHNFGKHWRTLSGHSLTVTRIIVGESFQVLASCDKRGNVAVWDPQGLNLMYYIDWSSVTSSSSISSSERQSFPNIDIHDPSFSSSMSTVSAMCFSETLGDLIISRIMSTRTSNSQPVSNISLFTINGDHVHSTFLPGTVVSLSYTNLPEGRHVNAIASVTSEGRLAILSSWNLQVVWKIKIPLKDGPDPVISVQYTHSGKELFVLHKSGHVKVIQSNKSNSTFKQSLYFWL